MTKDEMRDALEQIEVSAPDLEEAPLQSAETTPEVTAAPIALLALD